MPSTSQTKSVFLASAPPGRPFGRPRTLALADPQLLAMSLTARPSPELLWLDGADLFAASWPAGAPPRVQPTGIRADPATGLTGSLARDGSTALLGDGPGVVGVATRPPNGPWAPAVALGEHVDESALSALPGAQALVAWQADTLGNGPVCFARVRGGRVRARRLLPGTDNDQGLLLRGRAYGRITLNAIYAAVDPGSGPLPKPQRVAPGAAQGEADIAAVPGDRLAVGWGDEHGVHLSIRRASPTQRTRDSTPRSERCPVAERGA